METYVELFMSYFIIIFYITDLTTPCLGVNRQCIMSLTEFMKEHPLVNKSNATKHAATQIVAAHMRTLKFEMTGIPPNPFFENGTLQYGKMILEHCAIGQGDYTELIEQIAAANEPPIIPQDSFYPTSEILDELTAPTKFSQRVKNFLFFTRTQDTCLAKHCYSILDTYPVDFYEMNPTRTTLRGSKVKTPYHITDMQALFGVYANIRFVKPRPPIKNTVYVRWPACKYSTFQDIVQLHLNQYDFDTLAWIYRSPGEFKLHQETITALALVDSCMPRCDKQTYEARLPTFEIGPPPKIQTKLTFAEEVQIASKPNAIWPTDPLHTPNNMEYTVHDVFPRARTKVRLSELVAKIKEVSFDEPCFQDIASCLLVVGYVKEPIVALKKSITRKLPHTPSVLEMKYDAPFKPDPGESAKLPYEQRLKRLQFAASNRDHADVCITLCRVYIYIHFFRFIC